MIENRQQTGWDTYLAGSGMMITKIQWNKSKWEGNTVNNTSSKLGVDIIEAKRNTSSTDKATDLYPKGATSYIEVSNYRLTNIAMSNKVVTFDVNGGGENIVLAVENVQSDKVQSTKVLRNGQLLIMRDGKTYDVMGRIVD